MTESNPPDDDPFAEFEDWLVDGPAGKWPWGNETGYSTRQVAIAGKNARDLFNGKVWLEKVARFEKALTKINNLNARLLAREKYEIRFDGCNFGSRRKLFAELEFPCATSFANVVFGSGDVDFHRVKFSGKSVSFFQSVFGPGVVNFSSAIFDCERNTFFGSIFNDCGLVFDRAEFRRDGLSFDFAKISGPGIWFLGTKVLRGDISFREAQLDIEKLLAAGMEIKDGGFDIEGHQIHGDLLAAYCRFRSANFSYLGIEGRAVWSGSQFQTIPDFRGLTSAGDPEISEIDVAAPILAAKDPLSRAENSKDVLKLRKLKAMAIAANDHEKDGEFFAYEMMAKRGVEHTTFWQLFFNTIYWKVSFYGQSYLRPLGWLGGSFATFAAIYSLMAALPIGGWQSLAFGITYSFKNSLPFLGTLTRSVPSPEGHVSWFALQLQTIKDAQPGPDWFTVLGTGQAMLSLFFFFFLLLGLRNKFRLK